MLAGLTIQVQLLLILTTTEIRTSWSEQLIFFKNIGTKTNFQFDLETDNFVSDEDRFVAPTFVEIDNDGDLDLFVSESGGNINFYRNSGTATNPAFALETKSFASIDVGFSEYPTFADVDNDGDFDLIVGESDGNVNFFRNTGTADDFDFVLETENLASTLGDSDSYPALLI